MPKSLPIADGDRIAEKIGIDQDSTELRTRLWTIVNALQSGLKEKGFNIGKTQSPVTPVVLQGGISEAASLVYDLRENYRIFCSMIIYPVVPKVLLCYA